MFQNYVAAIVAACLLAKISVNAECPNACSAHGKCGAFDMCTCYRNWMASDCSERVCQFNLAHVDTPKGDLDASSGKLTGPSVTVVANSFLYPQGTQEQFPSMVDSDGNQISNSAHYYMECSNKGTCDRGAGVCNCFDGYTGSGCQFASCPSSGGGSACSGHGTCESIRHLAKLDNNNIYNLWDQDSTMGCKCDSGFYGPDCSLKQCKFGADPLYFDDYQNIRYANFTYEIYTLANTTISGNYSLVFTDIHNQEWQTAPISIYANCDDLTSALESIPNNVIPAGYTKCYQHEGSTTDCTNTPICDATGVMQIGGNNTVVPGKGFAKFTIAFPKNPGNITEIKINKYLDGSRPTLYTGELYSTLAWHIYSNGFKGEDDDLVPDECTGVLVTLLNTGTSGLYTHSLQGLTTATAKLLKICLGDSDGDTTNNVEVYNWDYGNTSPHINSTSGVHVNYYQNPHLIKLIDATQDTVNLDSSLNQYPISKLCTSRYASLNTYLYTSNGVNGWCTNNNPPGFYAVLFFDGTTFNLITRAALDYSTSTNFHVYTTQGFLRRVSPIATAFSYSDMDASTVKVGKYYSNKMYTSNSSTITQSTYYGNVDCESNSIGSNAAVDCLNKGDYVMFLNVDLTANGENKNPRYPNLYTVKKIGREPINWAINQHSETLRHQIILDSGVNTAYSSFVPAAIYKFHPPTGNLKYNYVAECSNRGLCGTDSGLCTCFPGYTSDDCSVQNALAH